MDNKIELGLIGLGKMGFNMGSRMLESGDVNLHTYDINEDSRKKIEEAGGVAKTSIKDLVSGLWQERKIIWMMLPSGKITEDSFQEILSLLKKNDIIIDGGNSNFHDTLRRHKECEEKGIKMLDVGVSGGIIAATKGYPMMIGGEKETYEYCKRIFDSFGLKEGFDLVGKGGSGHYVKMIHNAIEYGMMQSISEGFDLLKNGRIDNLDLKRISHIWNHGTIVSSFLMEMVEQAFENSCEIKDCNLEKILPIIDDNGEGRWSANEAMEFGVPFVANTYALQARYISRDQNSFSFKLTAAIRNEFGGHTLHKK